MSTQVPPRDEERAERRRRLLTLLLASLSSAVAAVVVRKIWGPGTVIGAAATPIIVALVADALNRPAEKIRTVAVPVLSGSRSAGDAPPRHAAGRPRPRGPEGRPQERTAPAGTGLGVPQVGRRGLLAALGVGLVAFVIGVGLLTGGEIVFGDSAGPNERRTTVFGGKAGGSKPEKRQDEQQKAPVAPGAPAPSTTKTTTETTTETTPAPPPPAAEPPAAPEGDAPVTPPSDGTTGP